MNVDALDALWAFAILHGVGCFLFWANEKIIKWTADAVFGPFQRQGADAVLRLWSEEDEEKEAKLVPAVSSEGQDFEPPPVQVIDEVGKKCD